MKELTRIVQVSTSDMGGGAEKVAYELHRAYRSRGHPAWLAVGRKSTSDPHVRSIPNSAYESGWPRLVNQLLSPFLGRVRGAGRARNLLAYPVGQIRRSLEARLGIEDFNFPGTRQLFTLGGHPDILHCHNLHGGYFDLRVLPGLCRQLPVLLTLHDAWLLSGHCAHSFECDRWKRGCGHCPDLMIYPTVKRDATAYNWRRKQQIFAKSRFYVSTPSRWLMQKVEQSMLAPGIVEARIIPNGVDRSVFHPTDRQSVRRRLGTAQDTKMLLFSANGIRRNMWKDYETLRTAVALVGERLRGGNVLFIAVGEDGPAEQIGQTEIRFVPYQKDPEAVACYYQAADVYAHTAKADTFPNTVLEALACGTPVVATAVGGIPEQVRDGETGFLTPAGDPHAMAAQIDQLLNDDGARQRMGRQAAEDARIRFDLNRQVDDYLNWYQEALARWAVEHSGPLRRNVQVSL